MRTFTQLLSGTQKVLPVALKTAEKVKITSIKSLSDKVFDTVFEGKAISKSTGENVHPILAFKSIAGKVPSITKDGIHVRCECLSYYFWCWFSNHRQEANYGEKFPKYVSTSSLPKDHPLRAKKNPSLTPMVCKHVIALAASLSKAGKIK